MDIGWVGKVICKLRAKQYDHTPSLVPTSFRFSSHVDVDSDIVSRKSIFIREYLARMGLWEASKYVTGGC